MGQETMKEKTGSQCNPKRSATKTPTTCTNEKNARASFSEVRGRLELIKLANCQFIFPDFKKPQDFPDVS